MELLQLTHQPSDRNELLSIGHASAQCLKRIVDDVLLSSKAKSGKLELRNEVFNVHELVALLIQHFEIVAKESNTAVVYSFHPPGMMNYIGDKYRIGQILFNLFSNAVKFSQGIFIIHFIINTM